MKKHNKIDEAIMDCYTLLYENSTPSANFQELKDNAEINEFGQKDIKYKDYEIEKEKCDEIINLIIKKHKIKRLYRDGFKNGMYLGCCPIFKKEK